VTEGVGHLLRDLRRRRGESLRSAARELGVDAAHLSRLERGLKSASDELRDRAADYYAYSPELIDLAQGRLPGDVVEILQEHPALLNELRARFGEGK
jgi:transcriptional regulator with XRE-family HTH domain